MKYRKAAPILIILFLGALCITKVRLDQHKAALAEKHREQLRQELQAQFQDLPPLQLIGSPLASRFERVEQKSYAQSVVVTDFVLQGDTATGVLRCDYRFVMLDSRTKKRNKYQTTILYRINWNRIDDDVRSWAWSYPGHFMGSYFSVNGTKKIREDDEKWRRLTEGMDFEW